MGFLEDLISRLDGLRTLLVYDSPVTVWSLLFHHILSHFESKNVYLAIYSESMNRRASKSYESLLRTSPEKARNLDKVNIIKIGTNEEIPFGKLYEFIKLDESWCDKLENIIKNFDNSDVVIFHGFSLVQILYDKKWLIQKLRFFDHIPPDVTIINKVSKEFYSGWEEGVLKKLHDVVIKIEKSERGLVDYDNSYLIGVEQSIIVDVPINRFARFRLNDAGIFEEY